MAQLAADQVARTAVSVAGLTINYTTPQGPAAAVRDVSFAVEQGEIFGLVG